MIDTPFSTFNWFTGTVEDVLDPKKAGRVRVRLHGVHSEEKVPNDSTGQGIKTEHLPWAHLAMGNNSASLNGVGVSPTGMQVGTWVFGVSLDGGAYNTLLVLGTIPGREDVAPVAKGENDSRVQGKPTDIEPKTKAAPVYPHNKVISTSSGHLIELDDTDGAERIHVYHKSGSFVEFYPDGTTVTKSVADAYEIVHKDKQVLVKGSINIKIEGNATLDVDGNINATAGGNVDVKASGSATIDAADVDVKASGSATIDAGSADVKADGIINIKAGGVCNVEASGVTTVKGATVALKGSKSLII